MAADFIFGFRLVCQAALALVQARARAKYSGEMLGLCPGRAKLVTSVR